MKIIEQNISEINRLCDIYNVLSLYVFGSLLNEKFSEESDIDMLVEFKKIDPEKYADNYFDLKFQLEELLKRKIDMLEYKAIQNPYLLKNINQNKQLIYG